MALPLTGITTSMVAAAIGEGSNDVGTLCTSSKINMWSKWKPVRSNSLSGLTDTDIQNLHCGLNRPDMWTCEYLKPRGSANSEYFRLGDFRNYNHSAVPPVTVEIVKITELSTNNVLSSPYILFFGFSYKIEFKLPLAGEIDPLWINSQTSRTKNTTLGGGYGGLSWVSGTNNAVTRTSAEVFTCPSLATVLEQTITLAENGLSPALRLQYCQFNGEPTNDYTTLAYAIEDTSYLNLFSCKTLALTLSLNTVWDPIAEKVSSRLTVVNDTGRTFSDLRARFVYTINGGSQITHIASIATLNTGTNNTVQYLNTGNPGSDNTYAVTCYLERYDTTVSNWVQMGIVSRTQVVSIPNL